MMSLRQIAKITSDVYGVPFEALTSRSRLRAISNPRQAAFALMQSHGRATLPAIGRYFYRDHTTILHGVRAHAKRYTEDENEREMFRKASNLIQANSKPLFKSTRGTIQ